jgi:predicted transcriptional regulator
MSKKALKLALEALEDRVSLMKWQIARDAVREALAQQEQGEPVLWAAKESMFMWGKSDESGHPYHIVCKGKKVKSHQIPLYTTPQQLTWVGLTPEQVAEFETWHDNREEEVGWCNPSEIVAYIEAKLKEKNT